MRKSGDWMVLWDDRILETIRNDKDKIGRVGDLAENKHIRISRSSVSRRCQKLADHGLLRKVGDGVYILTERGEKYLNGEINTYEDKPDELPQVDDNENGVPSPDSPEQPESP